MERLNQISDDVREIRSDVSMMKEHVIRNTADLAHHIKRTDLLESKVLEHASVVKGVSWTFKVGTSIFVTAVVHILIKVFG